MATAVLHNLLVLWNEKEPDDEDSDEEDDENHKIQQVQPINGNSARVQFEGTALQNTLLSNMALAKTTEARSIRQKM